MTECKIHTFSYSFFTFFLVRPTVTVSTESMVASPNSNVTFRCNASGIPEPVITWTKEGVSLPRRHSSSRNKLTLTRIVSSDEGRYICTATNAAGYSQKVVYLSVEGLYASFGVNLKTTLAKLGIMKPLFHLRSHIAP